MPSLSISLLGSPVIRLDDQVVSFGARKVVALLAYLVVTAAPHPRDALAALLWPEAGGKARASLRQALWSLSQAGLSDWLDADTELVRIRPGFRLDVLDFQALSRMARAHYHPEGAGCQDCVEWLSQAAGLYRGDFLAGFSLKDSAEFDDWQLFQAESLRQAFSEVLERLVGLHRAAGELEAAIPYARRWVALDPLHEPAYRTLMLLYAQLGKRGLAVKEYETLRQALDRELGAEPDDESQAVYKNIISGRLQVEEAKSMSSQRSEGSVRKRHNLPFQLTSLVGRQQEIAEIKEQLQPSSTNLQPFRLLTLTGPVGVGKTRMALETARELLDSYPDGVWFVELAGVSDPELVPKMVALSLNVQEQPGREIIETILDYLRSRRLLLLLDNCEHLVSACADLCFALLKDCPDLQILATSQQALGVSGEWTWLVPGLSLPMGMEPTRQGIDQDIHPEILPSISEAVQLFLVRARLIHPHFELTRQNVAAVAQICHHLDGLPLAIELAAARLNVLSPKEIAERLENRFQLLKIKFHGVMERHQTMLAAVEWSYSLLSNAERILFNRLSVFQSGFTLDAVEKVCADHPTSENQKLELRPTEILDELSSLVEKSMLSAELEAQGTVRYRLLETLRQYGWDRLEESGSLGEIRQRHAEYFLEFAEKSEPGLRSREHQVWSSRVAVEHDNLRAALQWAFPRAGLNWDLQAVEIAVRMAQGLWWFWYVHGYWSEGRDWYGRSLSLPLENLPPLIQVRAYLYASLFAISPGDQERALQLADHGLSLARRLDVEEGLAIALLRKGRLVGRKDPSLGTALLEESLSIFRRLGDPFFIGTAHYYLSYHLGWTFLNSGDLNQAAQWLQESLVLAESLGADLGMAITYSTLGQIARLRGDYERAESLFAKGLAICRQYGEDYQASATLANILYGVGQLAFTQGDHAKAFAYQKDALILQRRWGMTTEMAMSLGALAVVLAADQKYEQAVRLFAAVDAYRKLKGYSLLEADQSEHEHWLSDVQDHFDNSSFTKAWAEGQAMTLEQAMDYVLADERATV